MADTIDVDMVQLHDTCAAVRIDVEQGLRPGIADTSHKVQLGVRFGQLSPSGEADAAGRALRATLRRHRENCERHLSTADRLITTLDQVLMNYKNADAAASLDIRTVEAMLDAAAAPEPKLPRGTLI